MTNARPCFPAWQRKHLCISLPVSAYVVLHLVALHEPSVLWGADMLCYYDAVVTAMFVALPLVAAFAPRVRLPAVPAMSWGPAALAVSALPLLYLGRVRSHTLGDSTKWFAVVENAVSHHRSPAPIGAHRRCCMTRVGLILPRLGLAVTAQSSLIPAFQVTSSD